MSLAAEVQERVTELLQSDDFKPVTQADGDALWMLFCGALVFFMHAGFALLEAGSIHMTSVANIMFKNLATVSIGVLAYWFLGFGFAYPDANDEGKGTFFSGGGDFVGTFEDKALWFFQMVFAATAATIVSGAVAGRIQLRAYFLIALVLTAVVFPLVSHWIWDEGGLLSAFTPSENLLTASGDNLPCGTIDFAGSGVVHMTGGTAAFWGALILGPREGWAPDTDKFQAHNFALAALGTLILWFGWFGFNCGSTLAWDGFNAGNIAVTTTLAPAAAAVVGMLFSKLYYKRWDLALVLNCILGGLVSITAGTATIRPHFAALVGLGGGIVYIGASKLNRYVFKIDDPVDAVAVHGACGLYGLLCAGIFTDKDLFLQAYGNEECDTGLGSLLVYQLLAAIFIFVWVTVWALLIFGGLWFTKTLKIDKTEQYNVDEAELGGGAYNIG